MLAIFLDIETTGLDVRRHSPIDISFYIIDISENKVLTSYQSLIACDIEAWKKSDPRSLAVNGYAWDLVSQGKSIETVSSEIIALFKKYEVSRGKTVYICQNPTFDRSFFSVIVDVYVQENLNWPYHWLDLASMFWALMVKDLQIHNKPFPSSISLSKNDIAARYGIAPEQEPHRAIQGVEHLMRCYEAVLGVQFFTSALNK